MGKAISNCRKWVGVERNCYMSSESRCNYSKPNRESFCGISNAVLRINLINEQCTKQFLENIVPPKLPYRFFLKKIADNASGFAIQTFSVL